MLLLLIEAPFLIGVNELCPQLLSVCYILHVLVCNLNVGLYNYMYFHVYCMYSNHMYSTGAWLVASTMTYSVFEI